MIKINPTGRSAADPERAEQAARIKEWVRDAFHLGEELTITVAELRCTEPGCPPLETVIALHAAGTAAIQHKIHKSLLEVTRDDVRDRASGSTCQH